MLICLKISKVDYKDKKDSDIAKFVELRLGDRARTWSESSYTLQPACSSVHWTTQWVKKFVKWTLT